ncbi:Oligopeptide-binding protein oppA [Granulibacter bethesdensis]|uniref:Oligopeptide-binding protein oppA n=1 Tax=Granulibacter bethesdensis TaxID=364410 RepID=A0AAN0VGG1_9PROT|nr:extracellular solute-binding protein [Granulibacter bethesdensis]AHJ63877.1 Oligopeptide-binding protein oppA [Granulibacter bethesdensis]
MRRRSLLTTGLTTGLTAGAISPALFLMPGTMRRAGAQFLRDLPPGVVRTHAVTTVGAPQLPADFKNFPYANPDAPKGGEIVQAETGSFDSLNPFILRGVAGPVGAVWDTLLVSTADEPETGYAHLAQVIEIAADRRSVAFELRPEARFHDGHKLTAEDVAWTFETLMKHGRPQQRAYYADVEKAEAQGPHRVVFHFRTDQNRELPLIIGQLSVLPKHWWEKRDFTQPLTEPPLGSGPYQVGKVDFGRSLTMERVKDWWAANLPTGRGLYNFDRMRTEFFRDPTIAFEAFKAGQVDIRVENIARQWATGYDFPAVKEGRIKREQLPWNLPFGMVGFGMNTRLSKFSDPRVREAIVCAFDFEWANKNLFYGRYQRLKSYYTFTECASSGLPSKEELALLEPFRTQLPPRLFTEPYTLPVTDGSGNNRDVLRHRLTLLKEAGWTVKEGKLVDASGQQLSFEILLDNPPFERVLLPYTQSLAKLGIDARIRSVDPAQAQHLQEEFNFDMALMQFPESDSPGNEQIGFWSSASAKEKGSNNLMGVSSPVVDALVAKVITAPDRASQVTACRALDRVLLWGWYIMPNWTAATMNVAYWNRFAHVDKPVRSGFALDSWWAVSPTKG